ncbi:MAG: acyltransferase, partial [Actinobacteria bacterium]
MNESNDIAQASPQATAPESAAPASGRDPRLDSLRGLAMVAVVVGHVILGAFHGIGNAPYGFQFAFTVLTSFHVQLFAFISGYLTKPPQSVGDGVGAIGRRALQLLLPFAAWTTVFWLAGGRPLGLGSMLTALAGGTPPMWFLMALFVVSLFFYLFSWNETLLVVLTCLIALWPAAVPGFCVIQAERLVPFFVAGHLAKKHGWKTGWWTAPLYLAGMWAIWSSAGANLLFPTPLWTDAFNAWASDVWWLGGSVLVRTLRVAVPLCGIGALFLAGRRWTPLQGWGTRSLGVYAAHQLVLRLFA